MRLGEIYPRSSRKRPGSVQLPKGLSRKRTLVLFWQRGLAPKPRPLRTSTPRALGWLSLMERSFFPAVFPPPPDSSSYWSP